MTEPSNPPEAGAESAPNVSTLGGVIAALMPMTSVGLAGGMFVQLMRRGLEGLMETAPWSLLAFAAAGLSAVVLAVLLFVVAGRAWRVPVAALISVALFPMAPALVGAVLGTMRMQGAVPYAELFQRAPIAAAGGALVLLVVVLASWLSAALLGGLGLGLAIAAWSRRGPGRRWVFAMPAALLGLSAVVLPVLVYLQDFSFGLFALPATLAGAMTITLAAAAIGTDQRSGAQAAGAVFAALLAGVLTAFARHALSLSEGLGAFAHADASQRSVLLSDAIVGSQAGLITAWLVGGSFGLALAFIGGLALRRTNRAGRVRLLVAAAAAGLVALVGLGAPSMLEAHVRSAVEPFARQPWEDTEEFRTSSGGGIELEQLPQALVSAEQVIPFEGEPVSTADEQGMVTLFTRLRAAGAARWPGLSGGEALEDPVLGLEPQLDPPDSEISSSPIAVEHTLRLALDERLDAATIERVFSAVTGSGHQAVVLVGQQRLTPEQAEFVAGEPLLGRLARRAPEEETVLLPSALPPGYAEQDRALWHADVDASAQLELTSRGGARSHSVGLEREYGGFWGDQSLEDRLLGEDQDRPVVYLRIGSDVSPTRLLEAANRARYVGGRPLFVFGEIPGHPERELAP